jgi:PAS domain S-box-containing protein
VRDISERKQSEQRLRDSETKTRDPGTAVDGIITIDQQGTILSANRATERIFGYRVDEMVGHKVNMLMPGPYRSAHDGYLERYMTTGERRIIGIGREVQNARRARSFPWTCRWAKP